MQIEIEVEERVKGVDEYDLDAYYRETSCLAISESDCKDDELYFKKGGQEFFVKKKDLQKVIRVFE